VVPYLQSGLDYHDARGGSAATPRGSRSAGLRSSTRGSLEESSGGASKKAGYEPIEVVRGTGTVVLDGFAQVVALPTPGSRPPGMVAVSISTGGMRLTLTGFDSKGMPAPDYYIDRHEVTNGEFKAFVDAGGYEKRE
jgi:hypothetical protein